MHKYGRLNDLNDYFLFINIQNIIFYSEYHLKFLIKKKPCKIRKRQSQKIDGPLEEDDYVLQLIKDITSASLETTPLNMGCLFLVI